MFKALRRNASNISTTTSKLFHFPFQFPPKFLTTTTTPSPSNSFVISYFINTLNFSPQFALKASKLVHFKTSKKPDSIINFFKTHGFTDSDIHKIIQRELWLLSCNPHKRVLPKFQFLLSKGASSSNIVQITVGNPRFMKISLNNRVIPIYELVTKFFKSDQKTIDSIISCPSVISSDYLVRNVNLLVNHGVCNSSILRILRCRPNIIMCHPRELEEAVNELVNMGFNRCKVYFGDALLAKLGLGKSKWDEKVETFKKWGWSDETVLEAIRKQPKCMLTSIDKINTVMKFWVNELGWDSSHLVKGPGMFCYSMEKRIIPRGLVVLYLLTNGLISENMSLLSPFYMSEKLFLQRYVLCFGEDESSKILKLYSQFMNDEDKKTQKKETSKRESKSCL